MAREPVCLAVPFEAARDAALLRGLQTARTAVINQLKTAADGLDAEQQVAVTSPSALTARLAAVKG